ncbi:hypothetical protein PR202_ga25617 [Eleusine coracana subsp. coracana]|uniref:Uncharacterized protein n=1 Tax=Eleusine coracana subsp. coracana TaxID=191504 RepID=A0AAV5DBF5_ELECO|nr:hypothetical protein PR202_ga25617 [Eleusine coracana subsp. coracana]
MTPSFEEAIIEAELRLIFFGGERWAMCVMQPTDVTANCSVDLIFNLQWGMLLLVRVRVSEETARTRSWRQRFGVLAYAEPVCMAGKQRFRVFLAACPISAGGFDLFI